MFFTILYLLSYMYCTAVPVVRLCDVTASLPAYTISYLQRPLQNLRAATSMQSALFSDVQAGGLHLAAVSGPSLCSSSNSNTTRRQPSERDIRPDSAMYMISIF